MGTKLQQVSIRKWSVTGVWQEEGGTGSGTKGSACLLYGCWPRGPGEDVRFSKAGNQWFSKERGTRKWGVNLGRVKELGEWTGQGHSSETALVGAGYITGPQQWAQQLVWQEYQPFLFLLFLKRQLKCMESFPKGHLQGLLGCPGVCMCECMCVHMQCGLAYLVVGCCSLSSFQEISK